MVTKLTLKYYEAIKLNFGAWSSA